MEFAGLVRDVSTYSVRFTVLLSLEQIRKLKKWVNDSGLLHISTFVVACSLIWVCRIRSEEKKASFSEECDELCYLVVLADCRELPEISLPSTYFGNCIISYSVAIKRSELVGEDGIVAAANAIGKAITNLKSDPLRNAEMIISDYKEVWKPGKSVLAIAGSPKLGVYKTDFGWGKPKKCAAAHIESSRSVSLSDCRDENAGIEVGMALERTHMNKFTNILEKEIHNIDKSD